MNGTRIVASCGVCGVIRLDPDDITLEFRETPGFGTTAFCSFCCPRCTDWTERPLPDHIARDLLQAGVKGPEARFEHPERWPAMEPKEPFTEDEMIAFGQELERTIFPTEELAPYRN